MNFLRLGLKLIKPYDSTNWETFKHKTGNKDINAATCVLTAFRSEFRFWPAFNVWTSQSLVIRRKEFWRALQCSISPACLWRAVKPLPNFGISQVVAANKLCGKQKKNVCLVLQSSWRTPKDQSDLYQDKHCSPLLGTIIGKVYKYHHRYVIGHEGSVFVGLASSSIQPVLGPLQRTFGHVVTWAWVSRCQRNQVVRGNTVTQLQSIGLSACARSRRS